MKISVFGNGVGVTAEGYDVDTYEPGTVEVRIASGDTSTRLGIKFESDEEVEEFIERINETRTAAALDDLDPIEG